MKINWSPQSKRKCIEYMIYWLQPDKELGINQPPLQRWIFQAWPELEQVCQNYPDKKLRQTALRKKLNQLWADCSPDIETAIKKHEKYCSDSKMHKLSVAFADAFGTDCDKILRGDVTVNVGIDPICPRYLKDKSCDTPFWRNSTEALQMVIHETIHFIWFRIWKKHFHDSWDEYEMPNLKWVLSEMVIDPIIRCSKLYQFWPDKNTYNGMAYSYFYDMKIGGKPILETLATMYKNNSITDFMEQAYQYCIKHQKELQQKIADANAPKKKRH